MSNARITRAREGDFVVDLEAGIATSASSDETYDVDLEEGFCSCPDHVYRGKTCKHLYRALMRSTGKITPSPTDETGSSEVSA